MAANLRDLRRCLDLLQERPEVRGDKIGCAGLSYGGRMTMLVSAMDDRIRVAASSGAFNLLISPRWAAVFRERLERVYRALGADDQLYFDNFEGGHRWNGKIAFPVFDKLLRP